MSRAWIKIFKKSIFFFVISVVLIAAAAGAERYFYSIHLDSFRTLENANRKVNSLKNKGKLVFWMATDIPGEGKFYKLYLGKYENRDAAIAYWEKLKKSEDVTHFSIHLFNEASITTEKKEKKDNIKVTKKLEPFRASYPLSPKDRFVDNQDGTVTDKLTGLMWIKNGWKLEFIAAIPWFDAIEKVKNFQHGNYTDWRLPTVEEWSSLIDTNYQNPALIEPNPFENIISHMPYWSQSEFTYSRDHTCNIHCPFDSYTVMLYSGDIGHQKKSDRAFVLPVRTIVSQNNTHK